MTEQDLAVSGVPELRTLSWANATLVSWVVIEAPRSLPTLLTSTDYAHSELPQYSGDHEPVDMVQRTSPPLAGVNRSFDRFVRTNGI